MTPALLYFWILFPVFYQNHFMPKSHNSTKIEISEKHYLMGKFDESVHPDFVKVSAEYTTKTNIYLRKEVYEAYKMMYAAARAENINLEIISATRNFNYQKDIWERKWEFHSVRKTKNTLSSEQIAKKILKYSAMPGSSRHHWGTDIDLCNINSAYYLSPKGKKIYQWLVNNAHLYGFCQPYSSKKEITRTGYNEEKWHWSYQPASRVFTEKASRILENSDFTGFSGSESATEIDIVHNFILGINNNCY